MPVAAPLAELVLQLDGLAGGGYVDTLPEPTTATGALFYGAWALFGVTVLKKGRDYFRRSRSNPTNAAIESAGGGGSSGASKGVTTVGTTSDTGPSLSKGDHAAFVMPGFVPLSKGVREVTHNEIHAMELGAVLGFVISWLASIGEQNIAVFLAALFIAGALGYKRYRTKAFKTIRMEPWYAIVAFGLGAGIGWLFFTPELLAIGGVDMPI